MSPPVPKPRDVILCGPVAWDSVDQRPHHFIRRLARDRRVLWVNPGLTLEIPRWIAEPVKLLKTGRAYFKTERGPVRVLHEPPGLPNVRVLTVVGPLPFGGRSPLAHAVNAKAVALQVKAALSRFALDRPIFLAEHPKALALAEALGIDDIVYDCLDDFAAFDGYHDAKTIEGYENALFRKAKRVTASAKGLVARAEAVGARAELVPNGVELSHFRPETVARPIDMPPGARVFGFIGAIYEWIDLAWIEALARSRPQDVVVMVGPLKAAVAAEAKRLESVPNIRFIGPVPHKEVSSWVAAFDACLLPFKRNRLTESVNPLKLYEYFALGKPCLATAIPEIARWGELVALADSPAELPGALDRVLLEWSDAELSARLVTRRQQVAQEHAWSAITERFAAVVDGV